MIKRVMFDQKEVPDNIPVSHALSQQEAIKEFNLNKNDDFGIFEIIPDKFTLYWEFG